MKKSLYQFCFLVVFLSANFAGIYPAWGEDESSLAKKLANPIASLISLPFQFNYDRGIGPADDGDRMTLNVQPVVPFSIGENWNLISRTIVPVIAQDDIFPGSGEQSGLGDTLQSFFFSPKLPTSRGIIWGAGPVLLLPTATDDLLGGEKWAGGPTAVALTQRGPWTLGVLGNHLWSFAGTSSRTSISTSFLQPFASYTTSKAWTYSLTTEASYNWELEDWSVPINVSISKILAFGSQPVSLSAGVRYWAEGPVSGPEGWGFRIQLTFLFPGK